MSMSDTNVIGVCNNNSSNGYLTTVVERKMGCRKAKTRERKKNTKYHLPNGAIMQPCNQS